MSVFSVTLVHAVEENKKLLLKSWIGVVYSKINHLILLSSDTDAFLMLYYIILYYT